MVDTLPIFQQRGRESYFQGGVPIHTNKAGNQAVAQFIYDEYLKDEIARKNQNTGENRYLQKGEVLDESYRQQVNEYVEKVRVPNTSSGTVGAIVMNCNPFTYGHLHLIEYAAAKVDFLYLFVVEEDRSEYPFADRIKMVRKGTSHLTNVAAVPSGQWVLSYQTFSGYFGKSEKQEEQVDAEVDLEIFARYIAPQLGITIRFVGEEPFDKVTRQYNGQMKEILKDFDIEVEEIPRKQCNGEVISASKVRQFVKENNWGMVRRFVPETTYEYLKG